MRPQNHSQFRSATPLPHEVQEGGLDRPLLLLFAFSVGVIVMNLFAPQTLTGVIAAAFGLGDTATGLIGMVTLLGYATGLFLLVPLSDLVENRRLILRMLAAATIAAALAALLRQPLPFLLALFALGVASSAIQILVPLAAAIAAPEARGRVVGDVMSGLMAGILLARPLASFIAANLGWRAFYVGSALALCLLSGLLATRLPQRDPGGKSSYVALLSTLGTLLAREPVLRRACLTASLSMAAFSLFWTAIALRLAAPPFSLTQNGIAVFALVGAGGAVIAPLAGRAGDRGWSRPAMIGAHLAVIAGAALAALPALTHHLGVEGGLVALAGAAILLDIGVTGDQTLGRRAVNLLAGEARGRVNALFVGLFFIGGAIGAVIAGWAWSYGGWPAVCLATALCGAAGLIVDLTGRAGAK